jgi:hypothetical protein
MRRVQTEPYSQFDPREYLTEYYVGLSRENDFLLRFYHETYSALPNGLRLLEVGGGPTIYQTLSASRRAREIVFADYLDATLNEVREWLDNGPRAFDWTPYLTRVAELEGNGAGDPLALAARVRGVLKRLIHCDLTADAPLAPSDTVEYDVVSSAFCLEGISQDRRLFSGFLRRVGTLLRPGGMLVATVVRESEAYKVGSHVFPACYLDEGALVRSLERAGFDDVCTRSMATSEEHGYSGIMAVTGVRMGQGSGALP